MFHRLTNLTTAINVIRPRADKPSGKKSSPIPVFGNSFGGVGEGLRPGGDVGVTVLPGVEVSVTVGEPVTVGVNGVGVQNLNGVPSVGVTRVDVGLDVGVSIGDVGVEVCDTVGDAVGFSGDAVGVSVNRVSVAVELGDTSGVSLGFGHARNSTCDMSLHSSPPILVTCNPVLTSPVTL